MLARSVLVAALFGAALAGRGEGRSKRQFLDGPFLDRDPLFYGRRVGVELGGVRGVEFGGVRGVEVGGLARGVEVGSFSREAPLRGQAPPVVGSVGNVVPGETFVHQAPPRIETVVQPRVEVLKPHTTVVEKPTIFERPIHHVIERPSWIDRPVHHFHDKPVHHIIERPVHHVIERPWTTVVERPTTTVIERPANVIVDRPATILHRNSLAIAEPAVVRNSVAVAAPAFSVGSPVVSDGFLGVHRGFASPVVGYGGYHSLGGYHTLGGYHGLGGFSTLGGLGGVDIIKKH